MEGKIVLYLGNKLKSKGSNPTTVDLLSDALRQEGYTVYAYSSKKNKILRLIDMLLAIKRLRSKIDYALIDTYSTSAFWFAYISAKILQHYNIPYVPVLHGGNLPVRFKKNKKRVLWLLRNATINVSPSNYLYEFFNSKGIKHLVKIPNAIQIEGYNFKIRPYPKPHLLWVRAFAHIYNPLLAIKTLELLLATYPEAKLSMVGPVKDKSFDQCKSYIDEKQLPVTITGQLPKEDWIAYAEDFDVFLNTTTIDNMPVSVVEAMALGLLVVSTNVGGLPYLIEDGKDGVLVNMNDEKEMVKAIEALLENPALSKKISQNARQKAKGFSWEVLKERWLSVLK